jgi:2-oxoisovalerate dehydrogenase E1 component beta subunit
MATLTILEAVRAALWEEMERDERVFLIGEDIGAYGGAFKVTDGFRKRFGPDRVVDTTISEAAIIGTAIGAALSGLRPVAEMQFIDFIGAGFNQLVNWAAKCRWRSGRSVPIVVRGPSGGYVRGGPFHSQNVEAHFMSVAGLKMVYPSTAADAKGLLLAAIRDPDPVLFFEHKFLYRRVKEDVPEGPDAVPIGAASTRRAGEHASVVTYGATVGIALDAAEEMEREGVSVEVIDLRTLRPLDEEAILASVRKTGRVLVLHEDHLTGGIGGEVAARVAENAFEFLDAPVLRVAALDTPIPYAAALEDRVLPDRARVVDALRRLAAY